MALPTIGKFTLHNGGGFVCKPQFKYMDDAGNTVITDKGGDITLGFTHEADPKDFSVPDGSIITLIAFVVWGKDNEAKQSFIYNKNSPDIADYTITGTTLDNTLGLIGIRKPAQQ
jgi:hypothetical protein